MRNADDAVSKEDEEALLRIDTFVQGPEAADPA